MNAREISLRRGEAADGWACFAIFQSSIHDYLQRIGFRSPGSPPPDLAAEWPAFETLFAHLAATCAQWWIAHDGDGRPIGYARSIERSGTLELTEFFVAPGTRVRGVGRALLERAFPPGLGAHRVIVATTDAPAVALYLRFGVHHQATSIDLAGTPRAIALPAGVEASPAALGELVELERALLGHARPQDLAFMLADRPATILRRDGAAIAYAFEPNDHGYAGPVAALEPADLPAALAQLERAAHAAGHEELGLTVPLAASTAVDWLLGARGFRVDPFYLLFLADGPWAPLDRYLPFNPSFVL